MAVGKRMMLGCEATAVFAISFYGRYTKEATLMNLKFKMYTATSTWSHVNGLILFLIFIRGQ